MSLNIEQLKSDIDSIARSLGIQQYDVYGSTKEESSASSKNKKPFGLNSSSKSNMLIRVWNRNHQVGVTTTSNLTYAGLTDALILAHSSAEFTSRENNYDFSEDCLNNSQNIHIQQSYTNMTSMGELVEKTVQAETKILENSSVFKSVPYNKVSESISKKFYFNSLGAFKSEDKNISYCYFYPLAQEEGKIAREAGFLSIVNGFQNLNVEECAEKAILKTRNHLNYKGIKSGKYKIIFSPEAFLDLFNAFANFINAQNILDKKSLSTIETLNTIVASPLFNLYDSPLHDKNPSKSHFDEEGTKTQNTEIIKNGVLKSLLHSSFTAKKFETKSTGNGNIGSKTTVSPHFLHVIGASTHSTSFDLNNEKNTIFIEAVKSLHAGVNALQGSFSLPFDGFLLNNGEKQSIESATVAVDFLTLIKDICYVDNNEEVTASGVCSNVWIKELSITGNG